MSRSAGRLLLIFDLLGTFVFALQGAVAAVRGDLDPIGIACWHSSPLAVAGSFAIS